MAASSATVKPLGAAARVAVAAMARRARAEARSISPTRIAPSVAGRGSSSKKPSGREPTLAQSSVVRKRSAISPKRPMTSGRRFEHPPAAELGRVVARGLHPEHAFALCVRLQAEPPERQLGPGRSSGPEPRPRGWLASSGPGGAGTWPRRGSKSVACPGCSSYARRRCRRPRPLRRRRRRGGPGCTRPGRPRTPNGSGPRPARRW